VGISMKGEFSDFNSAWKESLRKYFKNFVELCWPAILNKIDWSKKPEMLEDELHALIKKRGN